MREVHVIRPDGVFTISVGTEDYIANLQKRNQFLPEEAQISDLIFPLAGNVVPSIEKLCAKLQKLPLEVIRSFSNT